MSANQSKKKHGRRKVEESKHESHEAQGQNLEKETAETVLVTPSRSKRVASVQVPPEDLATLIETLRPSWEKHKSQKGSTAAVPGEVIGEIVSAEIRRPTSGNPRLVVTVRLSEIDGEYQDNTVVCTLTTGAMCFAKPLLLRLGYANLDELATRTLAQCQVRVVVGKLKRGKRSIKIIEVLGKEVTPIQAAA